MRTEQATLPVGFFALSMLWPAPLLVAEFSWRSLVVGGLFFGTLGAASSTVVFLAVVGESPSPKRGAVAAAFASVVSAVLGLPVLTFAIWLVEAVLLGGSVDAGPDVLVGSMLISLVAVALSPLAAGLGYGVASESSRTLPRPKQLRRVASCQLSPATRTLLAAFTLLALAVSGAAAIQYADPTTADIGDAPAYAGPDAPAATQVEQAQARTRSVSHTVVWTLPAEGEDVPKRMDDRLVLRHDLQRDTLVFTSRFAGTSQTHLVTVDGHWYWSGNDTTPPPGTELTRTWHASNPFPYLTTVALDAPATVTDRNGDYVVVTYDAAGGGWYGGLSPNGTRTVRIDATTGRLVSVIDRDANGSVFSRIRFERYGRTSVDPPVTPVGPVNRIVEDLRHGPLTGKGTLY